MKQTFLKNLQGDIDTNNTNDTYLVLVNLYDSISKNSEHYSDLSYTFYNLLKDYPLSVENDLMIYSTLCNMPASEKQYTKGKFLSFNDNNNSNKYLQPFLNKFESLIVENRYNLLLNNCNFCLDNNNNNNNKEILHSFKVLVGRRKLDRNPSFLYSNLGKCLYDLISKSFLNLDMKRIGMFFNIVQLPLLPPPPLPPTPPRHDDDDDDDGDNL